MIFFIARRAYGSVCFRLSAPSSDPVVLRRRERAPYADEVDGELAHLRHDLPAEELLPRWRASQPGRPGPVTRRGVGVDGALRDTALGRMAAEALAGLGSRSAPATGAPRARSGRPPSPRTTTEPIATRWTHDHHDRDGPALVHAAAEACDHGDAHVVEGAPR